jgi:hypothetical protein
MATDFRSIRRKLSPEDFALGPKEEPEPSDLIDEDTWSSLVHLTDDVSLRTSDHHGTLLKRADAVWGWWVSLTLDAQSLVKRSGEDPLCLSCLTVSDEMQASTFSLMTGFYRQAISGLRSALEAMIAGVYFHRFPDAEKFERWVNGHEDGRIWFGRTRGELAQSEPFSLFDDPSGELTSLMKRGGWVDFEYATLCGSATADPTM